MKLKTLAQKAAKLPDLEFDWTGEEQWHSTVYDREIVDLPSLIGYVKLLRNRMAEQSRILNEITDAYMKLKEIILEAEID